MKAVYLHGFASGPESRKARFFRERLHAAGVQIVTPDLADGNFEKLTISGQLAVAEAAVGNGPVRIIGSSMGGYVGALLASRQPAAVEKLVLLAPAFGFAARWPVIVGQEGMEQWRRTGKLRVFHHSEGRERDLGIAMLHDSAKWDGTPAFTQPALIFHGVGDTVVPVEASRDFVRDKSNVRLFELASDHELVDVLDQIWESSHNFLLG